MKRMSALAIALAAVLLTAAGAYADTYGPRDDTQAPRGQDLTSPRSLDRGIDVQAPQG